MMYITIKFNNQLQGLTYPIVCLMAHPLINLRPKNPSEILMDFFTDLITKMPSICGHEFQTNAYIGVAVHKLVQSSSLTVSNKLIFYLIFYLYTNQRTF